MWKNLDQLQHDRAAFDTLWLTAHGVLPTADRLLRFGMSVSPWCHCGHRESIVHLFVECSFTPSLINWLQALMLQFRSSLPHPVSREIHFLSKKADNFSTSFCPDGLVATSSMDILQLI